MFAIRRAAISMLNFVWANVAAFAPEARWSGSFWMRTVNFADLRENGSLSADSQPVKQRK
jgi:hypothetical protein